MLRKKSGPQASQSCAGFVKSFSIVPVSWPKRKPGAVDGVEMSCDDIKNRSVFGKGPKIFRLDRPRGWKESRQRRNLSHRQGFNDPQVMVWDEGKDHQVIGLRPPPIFFDADVSTTGNL